MRLRHADLGDALLAGAVTGLRRRGARSVASRDPEERARYAQDPWAAARDIFGIDLVPQQDEVLEAILRHDRVLIPAANGVGKTFLLAFVGLWGFDCHGAILNEEGQEQGARILLPGPKRETVFQTTYAEMLALAGRASRRGHLVAGYENASRASVLWKVREQWNIEPFTPPSRTGRRQAHTAAGRHHVLQWALIEEGQGVVESLWAATEGMCSGMGNKVVSPTNPTEAFGPFYSRVQSGGWKVVTLCSFDHPNVQRRETVVPGAIAHTMIDHWVKSKCIRIAGADSAEPSPDFNEFLYALPPEDVEEDVPRTDGVPGHRDGEVAVWRPSAPDFEPKVLGRYPKVEQGGLISAQAYDAAVDRWKSRKAPQRPADRIGVDTASEGADLNIAVPSWGDDAWTLLTRWAEAQANHGPTSSACARMLKDERIYVGESQVLPKGRGHELAHTCLERFPRSWWCVEDMDSGKSLIDHGHEVLGHEKIARYNPMGDPPDPILEQQVAGNMRAAIWLWFAMLVGRGLIDLPPDALLRQEVLAMSIKANRSKRIDGDTVAVVYADDKKSLREKLGRSPDRADGVVISLFPTHYEYGDRDFLF